MGFNLERLIGSNLNILRDRVGTRWTFRLLAGVAGFCAVGYTAFQMFYVRPKRSKEKLYKPKETTVRPVLR